MLDVDRRTAADDRPDQEVVVSSAPALAADPTLDRTIGVGIIGGETLAWAGVLLTGITLRLVSLGTDALNATGARHAFAAYGLYRGTGTALDSAVGGPFATVFGALLLFLFGVSDQIVRLGPALAGIGMVALAIWLRPYLGRAGALLAGLLLAVSPSLVYFSRLEQPDAYAAFFALLLFAALLRTFDRGRPGDLILALAAGALLFVSAPVGPSLLLILVVVAALIWARGRMEADAATGAERPFGAAGLAAARPGLLPGLLLALALIVLIFSAFGSVPGNLANGPADWLGAWGRSIVGPTPAQPGRDALFALSLLPLYEPLALLAGLWAIGRRFTGAGAEAGTRGGPAARAILAFWAVAGIILLAIGGGQQPALILLAAVPLTLLAGAILGDLIERIDWRREGSFWIGGAGLILCAALALAAWGATGGQILQPSRFTDETARLLSLLLTVLIFALPLSGAAYWFARRIETADALRALAFGGAVLLLAYGFRSAVGLSVYRADVPNEPLIYNASTPEIRPLMERILRLSRDTTALNRTVADPTGGHGLSVAVDPAVEWPARWYLRDFPNLQVVSTSALATGAITTASPPQLILRPGDGQPPSAGGYRPWTYKLQWSYPAGQPLVGPENALLRGLGFIVFRNNVAPTTSADMTVEYSADLAERLFLPPPPQGPFNLDERPGAGKAPGQFDSPRGVAVAPDGSIYVVDLRNARIQQFSREGVFIQQFGGLGHNDGQLWRESSRGPTGLAIGPDGFLYVADTWNYRIQKFSLDGKFVAKWGTYGNLVVGPQGGDRSGLYGPRGIAFGPTGDVYVTDTGNGRVVVYSPTGVFRREFGTKGSAAGQLDEPVGIAVSADGSRVYVADSNNARIAVFDGQGQPVAQWDVDEWRGKAFFEPYLALAADGTLYATSSATRQVLIFNTRGEITGRISGGSAPDDTFGSPFGLALAADGTLYVSDGNKNFVVNVAPPGRR